MDWDDPKPKKAKKTVRKQKNPKPRTPTPQKTVIIRGDAVEIVEAYQQSMTVAVPFVSVLRYFMSLGVREHEKKNGAVIPGQPWDHEARMNANVPPQPGIKRGEAQVDIEDYFK